MLSRLAERLAAKLRFDLVHRRAFLELFHQSRHVLRRLLRPTRTSDWRVHNFRGRDELRFVARADFGAAHDRQHLPGDDAVPGMHVALLNEDSVGGCPNVDAVCVVVFESAPARHGSRAGDVARPAARADRARRVFRRQLRQQRLAALLSASCSLPSSLAGLPLRKCHATADPHTTTMRTVAITNRLFMKVPYRRAETCRRDSSIESRAGNGKRRYLIDGEIKECGRRSGPACGSRTLLPPYNERPKFEPRGSQHCMTQINARSAALGGCAGGKCRFKMRPASEGTHASANGPAIRRLSRH